MNYSTTNNDDLKVLALCRFSSVTPRLFVALIQHFGTLERVLRADSGQLMAIEGMTAAAANRISNAENKIDKAAKYLKKLTDRDITIATSYGEQYIHRLEELNNPPPLLYVRGNMPDQKKKTVALVGTEEATNEGIKLTIQLAHRFSKAGVQIVSSLNRGIDSAAHVGAGKSNNASFAVLESGFDNLHPPENSPLAIDIAQTGGVISEYAPETVFKPKNYILANRIIVGLSQAVVVTELNEDSSRILDLLACCAQVGKLCFLMIDPATGAHADQVSLGYTVKHGAIPIIGLDKVDDIIDSLV